MFAGLPPSDLLNDLGVHQRAIHIGADVVALLGVLAGGFAVLFKAGKWVGARIRRRRYSAEDERYVRRRRIFARFVDSRVETLDRKEEWADYRFAELEAEVETVGTSARGGRRRGLRHERSLSDALQRSRDRIVLLQGDPGSGKSVALRYVARKMARAAAEAKSTDAAIPLYINLKGLPVMADPSAQDIEDYILTSLREGNDRDVHTFLEEHFTRGKEEGTWFFLFDSFDEIPAVLSATELNSAVRAYSDAISGYIKGLNQCRAVLASRHFRAPPRDGLPTFRIVPLSEERKRELIAKADLGDDEAQLVRDLPDASPDVVALSENPLFLGLLCHFVRTRGTLPQGWNDVFEAHVTERIGRDRATVQGIYHIDSEELRSLAEEIAFTMTATEGLGLSPKRHDLLAAYGAAGFSRAHRVNVALNALEWIKLARSESGDITPVDPTFSFAHRRFQEYFATCVVQAQPERVPPEVLLTDASWRETAVTLCQTQPERTSELLAAAHPLLRAGWASEADDETDEFAWPDHVLHLLGVLQSGFVGRADALPDELQQRIGEILSAASRGTIVDNKWALEVVGSAPEAERERLLREAFRGPSDWLREAAYRQLGRLAEIPADLAVDIRATLLMRSANRTLRRDWLATRAQLLRLRPSEAFLSAARLLRAAPVIDLVIHVVGVSVVVALWTSGSRLVLAVALVAAAMLSLVGYYRAAAATARLRPTLPQSGSRPNVPRTAVGRALGFGVLFGAVEIRALIGAGAFGIRGGLALHIVLAAAWLYAGSWAYAAIWAAWRDPPQRLAAWLVLPARPVLAVGRSVHLLQWLRSLSPRQLLVGTLATTGFVAAFAALMIGVFAAMSTTIGAVVAAGLLVAVGLWFAVKDVIHLIQGPLHDARRLREWRRSGPSQVAPKLLLDKLDELRTPRAAVELLADVRAHQKLRDSPEAEPLILDLLHAIGRDGAAAPRGREWESSEFRRWVGADGDRLGPLGRFRVGVPDELGKLLEDVRQATEVPTA